ncbi:MAG: hypothetical protein AB7G65_20065 [Thermoleophilia bacterium]
MAPAIARGERRAAERFREQVRHQAGWWPADDAMTLLAWDADGSVAGCIDVGRARGGRFAMEERGVRVPGWIPRRTTGEVTRWAARPRQGLAVQVSLAEAAALWMRDEGLTHAIGLLTGEGRRRLERAALPMSPLAPPRSVLAGGRRLPLHPMWTPIPDLARWSAACRRRAGTVDGLEGLFNLA